MRQIISQVHNSLLKPEKTIAVAESCTGGLLSAMLTELSGSSKYFTLGVVTYNNKAKEKILGIPSSVLANKGAVSEDVAKLMAQKVRKLAKTDFGIAITGIAGPTGATLRKPVGTVFIAIADKNKIICKKFSFKGTRSSIRTHSALEALKLLRISVEPREQFKRSFDGE
jgi:nicotinamide-nucleotide amidase